VFVVPIRRIKEKTAANNFMGSFFKDILLLVLVAKVHKNQKNWLR
jgi:hypothetical protein